MVMVNTLGSSRFEKVQRDGLQGQGACILTRQMLESCQAAIPTTSFSSWLEKSFTDSEAQFLTLWKVMFSGTPAACTVSGSGLCPCVRLAWVSPEATLALLSPHVPPVQGPL